MSGGSIQDNTVDDRGGGVFVRGYDHTITLSGRSIIQNNVDKDDQDNNLYLSDANRSGGSVASVAVACHEAGHAAQRQSGYAMMKVRTALVPVVNFTQNTWTIVLLMGLFMNIAGLTTLALVFFSFSVLFQLVTLPVEIDASRRAVAYIEQSGMSSKQVNGAKKVLTAAALTYVAAALTSIIQLLYLMARYNRNSNR